MVDLSMTVVVVTFGDFFAGVSAIPCFDIFLWEGRSEEGGGGEK